MTLTKLQCVVLAVVLSGACGVKRIHAQGASIMPMVEQQFFDNNGRPLSLGLIYTYAAGTSTPQATYTASSGGANTNPVVLDSAGRAKIWLGAALAYKIDVRDALGNLIVEQDNVSGGPLDMATLDTVQTFTANKTFSGTQTFNNITVLGTCSGCVPPSAGSFGSITSGVNTGASMSVSTGATLSSAGTGVINFATGGHTTPWLVGLAAAKPATCAVGEAYFGSDQPAGTEVYLCDASNHWTQVSGGGGGGSAFSAITSGSNTTAAMVLGSGATFSLAGTGKIDFTAGGATSPVFVGTGAAIAASSCVVGQVAFASDATPGQNLYYCAATNTWTQELASGGGAAFSALTTGTNNSGVTMTVGSTSSLTTSGTGTITANLMPSSGGASTTTGAALVYDTTNKNVHSGANGVDNFVAMIPSGSAPTDGNCVKWSVSSSVVRLADTGSACGSGGGGSTLPVSDTTAIVKGNADTTKQMRIDVSTNVSSGATRVAIMPNTNLTLAGIDISQTFTQTNTYSGATVFNGSTALNNASNTINTATITNTLGVGGTATFSAATQFNAGAATSNVFANGWVVGSGSETVKASLSGSNSILTLGNATNYIQITNGSTGVSSIGITSPGQSFSHVIAQSSDTINNSGSPIWTVGNSSGGEFEAETSTGSQYLFGQSSVPSFIIHGTAHEIKMDASSGITSSSYFKTFAVPVASLPACSSNAGMITEISDGGGACSAWGNVACGGGSGRWVVHCNGVNWLVMGQ